MVALRNTKTTPALQRPRCRQTASLIAWPATTLVPTLDGQHHPLPAGYPCVRAHCFRAISPRTVPLCQPESVKAPPRRTPTVSSPSCAARWTMRNGTHGTARTARLACPSHPAHRSTSYETAYMCQYAGIASVGAVTACKGLREARRGRCRHGRLTDDLAFTSIHCGRERAPPALPHVRIAVPLIGPLAMPRADLSGIHTHAADVDHQ